MSYALCVICMEPLMKPDDVHLKVTKCGHLFHDPCLSLWHERSKSCPQCRSPCRSNNVHRVYLNMPQSEVNEVAKLAEQLNLKTKSWNKLKADCLEVSDNINTRIDHLSAEWHSVLKEIERCNQVMDRERRHTERTANKMRLELEQLRLKLCKSEEWIKRQEEIIAQLESRCCIRSDPLKPRYAPMTLDTPAASTIETPRRRCLPFYGALGPQYRRLTRRAKPTTTTTNKNLVTHAA